MKRMVILLALLSSGGHACANQEPHQIRISVQYISLPLRSLNELLAAEPSSDAILHDKVLALTMEGKAKLLDSNMVVCRTGQKSTVESIREEIFPTEYDAEMPTSKPTGIIERIGKIPVFPRYIRPWGGAPSFGCGFEIRNTGMTLEVEPNQADNPSFVDVRLVPELVSQTGLTTWFEHTDHWGKADIRTPVFETWRSNTSMTIKTGSFALVSSITPKRPLPVPFVETRILLFVRADDLGAVME